MLWPDTLVSNLTVAEMLTYTAELKLATTVTSIDKRRRVERVLDALSLRSCCNVVIGDASKRGVSGGQVCAGSICPFRVAGSDAAVLAGWGLWE